MTTANTSATSAIATVVRGYTPIGAVPIIRFNRTVCNSDDLLGETIKDKIELCIGYYD
jgi:hypothetical protein